MAEQQRDYPRFSACGLNCGLCPRYHTDGSSRCPGCAGEGFYQKHPKCGVLSCIQRRGDIEFCYLCQEFPCKKYDGTTEVDSFITHRNMLVDAEKAKTEGLDSYKAMLDEKVALLEFLLQHYNDGRKKGLYCLGVNLLAVADVRQIAERLKQEAPPGDDAQPVKQLAALAARLLEEKAEERGVVLKLNQKKRG